MCGHADHPPSTWVFRVDIVDQVYAKDVSYRNFFVDTYAPRPNVEQLIYGLRAFNLLSLLVRIQSRTSINTAFLLVRDEINDSLNFLLTIWSNVEIWWLGARGVLTFDDRAGDISFVMRVGIAARLALGEFSG